MPKSEARSSFSLSWQFHESKYINIPNDNSSIEKVTMEKQQSVERFHRRVVLVVYPFQGHINPMLQLATILHSKGFSITIVHPNFNSPNPDDHPDFVFLPISCGLPDNQVLSVDVAAGVFNTNCEAPFRQCMEGMMKEVEIACIIYNGLMYFSQAVADDLKLPAINLRTNAAATMLAFAVFPRVDGQGYITFQDSVAQDPVPELHHLNDRMITSKTRDITDSKLKLRVGVTAAMKASSAIIVNTIDFLEQETLAKVHDYIPVPTYPLGPFHKFAPASSASLLIEDTSCITWLDKQTMNSVIYASFGSIASMNEKELVEAAWGLLNSQQPFLWVIRDLDWIKLLPQNFKQGVEERGCIVKWAPQKKVLAHDAVGGFWSHCGWNSTLESICEGVPMLCKPFFGDQGLNAKYVSHVWKVGLELENENLERGDIERGIRRLMVDKEGEDMRQRAKDLKDMVELCLINGGSSWNEFVELILSF